MPIGYYVVLRDGKFSLGGPGGDFFKDLNFNLPGGTRLTGAVLSFMLDTKSPDEINFRVLINGSEQLKATYSQNIYHSVHEVVGGLRVGNNSATFELGEGVTAVLFGDVVLWFQVTN
jgi:hypothetical protein